MVHRQDHIPPLVPLVDVALRLGGLFERVAAVDVHADLEDRGRLGITGWVVLG